MELDPPISIVGGQLEVEGRLQQKQSKASCQIKGKAHFCNM